jgi:hypothetical protein
MVTSWGIPRGPTGTDFLAVAGTAASGLSPCAIIRFVAWGYDAQGEVSGVPMGTGFTTITGSYADGRRSMRSR